jgi:hypothetical protein
MSESDVTSVLTPDDILNTPAEFDHLTEVRSIGPVAVIVLEREAPLRGRVHRVYASRIRRATRVGQLIALRASCPERLLRGEGGRGGRLSSRSLAAGRSARRSSRGRHTSLDPSRVAMNEHPKHMPEELDKLPDELAAVGPGTGDEQEGVQGNAEQHAGEKARTRPFDDPAKAREAARERWRRARERVGVGESANDETRTLTVTVPVRVGTIIRALEKKAAAGETQAARELRSWLAEYPPRPDDDIDPADLPRALRQRLLARLIAEDEAAQADNP